MNEEVKFISHVSLYTVCLSEMTCILSKSRQVFIRCTTLYNTNDTLSDGKVQVSNDQEKAQSERNYHSKNQGVKN